MMKHFDPKLTWNSSKDDIINDFYRPALHGCSLYQRLSGYFSSSTFANVMNEVLEFIDADGRIQLITSPNLSHADKKMCEQSVFESEKLLATIFLDDLKESLKNDPDEAKLEFAKIMAYLLTNQINGKPQMEMKIAIPSAGTGMYHQKIGIMWYDGGERVAFSGSVNETGTGWHENIENFTVFRSWGDDTNNQGVVDNQRDFNDLWNNKNPQVRVFDLPDAVRKHMLAIRPKSDEEYKKILDKLREKIRSKDVDSPTLKRLGSMITLRSHQKEAIRKWGENQFRGILEMATGTGKTFAAFGCINNVQHRHARTLVVIACPQKHLVDQWESEFHKWNSRSERSNKIFNDKNIVCNSDNPKWRDEFRRLLYDFNIRPLGSDSYITNNVVVFTTHDTLQDPDFRNHVLAAKSAKKLLIIDEVHNITENMSHQALLENFDFRLGLSATPQRHMDEKGTRILSEYFGGIVYQLGLNDAIHKHRILCPYNYYPYYVQLTADETDEYHRLTAIIARIESEKQRGTYRPEPNSFDPYMARSDLVANAQNKDAELEKILDVEFGNTLSLTLIYCTNNPSTLLPDSPRQLQRVKEILTRRGLVHDSVTWEDKTKDRHHILDLLSKEHFDCVTAVKCLDEGVDIPSVEVGIIMASSGNPRQFIQRRGRMLRKSEKTGKRIAAIYDILVAPPIQDADESSLSQRKLVARELVRHKEFASIAENKHAAIVRIRHIADAFGIDLNRLDYDYIQNMTKNT